MNVYESFDELEKPGRYFLPMPRSKATILGGHAVTIVGYNLDKKYFIVRNSFGAYWGDKGYFYVPFDYAKNDFLDQWTFDIAVK